MITDLERKLIRIGQKITDGVASYEELAFLEDHKQEVLTMGDIVLCEQAGITEEEYNKGELNPDLFYDEGIIRLEIDHDNEGNAFCKIAVEDEENLVINQYELEELKGILDRNYSEIQEYFHRLEERYKQKV